LKQELWSKSCHAKDWETLRRILLETQNHSFFFLVK
jgi:hypothetical protein